MAAILIPKKTFIYAQGVPEFPFENYLLAAHEPVGLQFVEFKRRCDGFRLGHNQGFQSCTHFLGTLTGQKIIHQNL